MMRYWLVACLFWTFPAVAAPPTYISLKAPFQNFVKDAQGTDFETQLKLWQTDVESVLPDVYAHILKGQEGTTPDQNRRKVATKWFPFLLEHANEIVSQFNTFDQIGWPMTLLLASNFPDVDFSDVRVIALPSLMSFNGQVATVSGHAEAMFGMDFLELVAENPKLIDGADLMNDTSVLVAHELTHVLQDKVSDVGNGSPNLLAPLWLEGLAEMHSQMLVPGTDLTTVFMERNLAAHCVNSQVPAWVSEFIADSQVTDEQKIETEYAKWFMMRGWESLGAPRAGYCIGYHVVLAALRNHSFDELIHMKQAAALPMISRILASMATPQFQSRR